jgi:hypothetical protein
MSIVNLSTRTDCDFNRSFAYKLNVPITGGTELIPFDLTGARLRMGVRVNATDREEQMQLTTENGGITIFDAVNGMFTITINQPQLLALPVGTYVQSLVRIMEFTDRSFTYPVWSGTLINQAGPSR